MTGKPDLHRSDVSSRARPHVERGVGLTAFAAFVATVWIANWLVSHFGIVPVGFGLEAPAAVFAVGVAFTLRDVVQRSLGRRAVVLAVLIGAALSYTIAPAFATASAVAFLASELVDFAVYTPLRERSWLTAVALSNTVGAVIDSLLFLSIAFGSLAFFWGQVVGKTWVTAAAVLLIATARAPRRVRAVAR